MTRLLKLICSLTLATVGAIASEYCSLAVKVLSPEGMRFQEVMISVREQNGRITEKEATAEDTKFCDLGILPATVTIGESSCMQVIVRDVPLAWQEQQVLTVTYDSRPCFVEKPPVPKPLCQVALRVADVNTKWIDKAEVRFDDAKLSPEYTDSAGRAVLWLQSGEQVHGTIRTDGYSQAIFSATCSQSNREIERLVILRKYRRIEIHGEHGHLGITGRLGPSGRRDKLA